MPIKLKIVVVKSLIVSMKSEKEKGGSVVVVVDVVEVCIIMGSGAMAWFEFDFFKFFKKEKSFIKKKKFSISTVEKESEQNKIASIQL